jgi:hypothetical protein
MKISLWRRCARFVNWYLPGRLALLALTLVGCQFRVRETTALSLTGGGKALGPGSEGQRDETTPVPDDEAMIRYLGDTPQLPAVSGHPHLFFIKDDLLFLRARGERELYLTWLRNPVQSTADDVLEVGAEG